MPRFLLSFRVVSIALPLLGVVAVIIGGLASPTIAYILVGIAVVGSDGNSGHEIFHAATSPT